MEKIDFRSLSSSERYSYRKRAISLIKTGELKKEVAKFFGVRANTVSSWVKSYKSKGLKGLEDINRGMKSEDRKLLTLKQEKVVQKMILDTMPDRLKLPYTLWARKAVKELIEREFSIVLAITTTGNYLRSWGYSPQKPKKKAYGQNSKAVQKWLNQEYPAIKEKAKQEKAEIHWGDETGVRNNCQHGRSYVPKGKAPTKKSISKRFSTNMISTVTNQGRVEFMIYSGTMNSDMFIEFLEQFVKKQKTKRYLILDNLSVHHSKPVKQWVEEHSDALELFFLPSYSPEKNPDEYLNCDLKQGSPMKPAPENQDKPTQNLNQHLKMLQQNPNRAKN
ncbi:Mobile element protein [hydrothermal vent metagenome]|uniref:Mobile element protein n=1 Tax=hydrothermal vent metagenome TaxID=652676 RepID=A0A3B0T3F0_9ZZZZ